MKPSLIKLLAGKSSLKLLRDLIFCKHHYNQSFTTTFQQLQQKAKYISAINKADIIYTQLQSLPEFNTILSYINKQSQPTVKVIIKDTIKALTTNKLI